MGVDNILPQKGIKVMLGGEEKVLMFKMRTMAELSEKYGSPKEILSMFDSLKLDSLLHKDYYAIADFVACALSSNDNNMTQKYIMDNFDFDDIITIFPEVTRAFLEAVAGKNVIEKRIDSENP